MAFKEHWLQYWYLSFRKVSWVSSFMHMFYESLIAQEMVHVLEHVENDVSSIFKLTFHWYDVYRNRLHQLSDKKIIKNNV